MDITSIYSSSYDRTGIKDYAIFKNVNLTQLNNKFAYLKNILIYRYMHTQKYYVLFCVLHVLDSIAKHHSVSLTDRETHE